MPDLVELELKLINSVKLCRWLDAIEAENDVVEFKMVHYREQVKRY